VLSPASMTIIFIVELKTPIDLVPPPACSPFWEQTLRLLKVHARFNGFCRNQMEPIIIRRRSVGLPRHIDCHVPSSSLHAQTSSSVKLYTRPTVCGVVDIAIVSPLALSQHRLHDKAHQFDCLCYHTVLL
jgi:hypothetical protein